MSLLYNFKDSAKIEEIVMPWPSDEYTIPAGTPMSLTGIATGSDAVGILASDEHFPFSYPKSLRPETPKGQMECKFAVITGGVVNLTAVEKSAGAIPESVKNALNISFVCEGNGLPFGEKTVMGDTLTWDGEIDGLYNIFGRYYHISDVIPTLEDLKRGGSITWESIADDGGNYTFDAASIMDLEAVGAGKDCYIVTAGGSIMAVGVVLKEGATATLQGMTATFEKVGIYLLLNTLATGENAYVSRLTINGYNGFERTEIVPIPEKYLPSGVIYLKASWDANDDIKVEHPFDEIYAYANSSAVLKLSLNGWEFNYRGCNPDTVSFIAVDYNVNGVTLEMDVTQLDVHSDGTVWRENYMYKLQPVD